MVCGKVPRQNRSDRTRLLMALPTVWRINIKTAAQNGIDPRQFCLSRDCLGVGWPVGDKTSIEWDAYFQQGTAAYAKDKGWWPALNAIRNRMVQGDLCWTRDTTGLYYLGRITGPWRYVGNEENRRADVVNLRPCEWVGVGPVDAVPGKVVSSFRPSRTVQVVDDETVRVFSAYFYNAHSKSGFLYDLPAASPDIFSLLSSEDCEDLVALYMQMKGYMLLPSTCKRSTSAYEFVMRHRVTGEHAAAQVKNGFDDLHLGDYSSFPGTVFLFTSKGRYVGMAPPNVSCVTAEQILQFIHEHDAILPDRTRAWLGISRDLAPSTRAG
jgi:hypothetical protein